MQDVLSATFKMHPTAIYLSLFKQPLLGLNTQTVFMHLWCNSHREHIRLEGVPHHIWNSPPFLCTAWLPCRHTDKSIRHTEELTCDLYPKAPGDTAQPCPWNWASQKQAQRLRRASGSCMDVGRSVATIPQPMDESSSMEIAAAYSLLFALGFSFSSSGCPQFSHIYLSTCHGQACYKWMQHRESQWSFIHLQ